MLSKEEFSRYNRHIILSEVGQIGQEKLKNARVLLVGVGGLGCPIAQYLVAAGVGTVVLVDGDLVSESNLQRQILFNSSEVGKPKAAIAQQKLASQNPLIAIKAHVANVTKENVLELIKDIDIVVDGTDNFASRYLLNDACILANKVLIYGAIYKFEGQVSVFNYNDGPTYRCLFPEPPLPGSVPNCSQIGVLGVLPGVIGAVQANEVIKVILGKEGVLSGKLWTIDLMTMQSQIIGFKKNKAIEIKELIDYDIFCGFEPKNELVQSISCDELNEWIEEGKPLQLIDVRENHEREISDIGGIHIPLGELRDRINEVSKELTCVVYCHYGHRSKEAVELLAEESDFDKIFNLEGGIDEWSQEIDSGVTRY